jgi:hypothetical protein
MLPGNISAERAGDWEKLWTFADSGPSTEAASGGEARGAVVGHLPDAEDEGCQRGIIPGG